MKLSQSLLKNILESAIFASPSPLSVEELLSLFADEEKPTRQQIQTLIKELQNDYATRPLEVVEVASGYRFQVRAKFSPWISKMWQDKPPKLSRAMLETLAIIAYRQPVTRAEIKTIHNIIMNTQIIKTLFNQN